MVISHPNRYVYIAIPKTACQAVSQWLVENHWGEYVPPMTHRWWIPEDCAGYTIFTVVRNPYERCFSFWWFGCRDEARKAVVEARGDIPEFFGWSFERFMRWQIDGRDKVARDPETGRPNVSMTQKRFFELSGASLFFHHENLTELSRLPFISEFRPIPPRNVTQGKPKLSFNEYFAADANAEELVWEYCGGDFGAFGYERQKA